MTALRSWEQFVLEAGPGTRVADLAHVVGQPQAAVRKLRLSGAIARTGSTQTFHELFQRWHGRAPIDADWPVPVRSPKGRYAWLAPELALVASLVGRMGTAEIARVLTERLRRLTGDPRAERTVAAVQIATNRAGLEFTDVVGGLTVAQAARKIGVSSILYNEIAYGRLKAHKVGRLLVIPHEEFARWQAGRVMVPKGYVRLTSIKQPLGFRSDKLAEFAKQGRIPGAIRCNPYGTRERGTIFGTWYIPAALAKKLVADRRAGRPMPWWGTVDQHNLKVTFRLWQKRKHPARCQTCAGIWGPAGAPTTFEDYAERYPPIAHGAKRHLTLQWSDGITVRALAAEAKVTEAHVKTAIANGVLRCTRVGRSPYVSRADATRWLHRRCPTGGNEKSWVTFASAKRYYGFTRAELESHIAAGRLASRVGTVGDQNGVVLVSRQQCRELRDALGYSMAAAARRLRITVARLQTMLRGTGWREGSGVHAETINTIRKRLDSAPGITIAAAAKRFKRSRAWVEREISLGTARVLRGRWRRGRRYLSRPQLKRLEAAAAAGGTQVARTSKAWLLLSDAALLAGVSVGQIQKWARQGEIRTRLWQRTHRYHERSVKARARKYWTNEVRFRRKVLPTWLDRERAA